MNKPNYTDQPSGKTNIHIYVPCERFNFPDTKKIALSTCKKINTFVPDLSTTENIISKRGNKVFVDYNQNDEDEAVASAYSVRATPTTVSTPL